MTELWSRRLRPATFRGVPFKIDSHDFGAGRKIVSHETTGDEITFAEDMGRKTQSFRIDGFVIGDDVFRLRDNLIKALEKEGEGELVHPYLGIKQVKVVGFNVAESSSDGRVANFTIEFVEAGKANFPVSIFDVVTDFFDTANDAIDAVNAGLEAVYRIAGFPSFVLDEAEVTLRNAFGVVKTAISKVRSIPSEKAKFDKRIQDLRDDARNIASNASTLSKEVSGLIVDMDGIIQDLETTDAIDIESGNDDRLTVYSALTSFEAGFTPITTGIPSALQVDANKWAMIKHIRQTATIALAGSAIIKSYPTLDDATQQKEKLIDLIEAILDTDIDDVIYQAFSDLKGFIIKAIPNDTASLQNEVELNITGIETSLTAVYDLTGSIKTEADFIKRNKIVNPSLLEPMIYKAVNK
jgi:prophage DNA circulation protein